MDLIGVDVGIFVLTLVVTADDVVYTSPLQHFATQLPPIFLFYPSLYGKESASLLSSQQSFC